MPNSNSFTGNLPCSLVSFLAFGNRVTVRVFTVIQISLHIICLIILGLVLSLKSFLLCSNLVIHIFILLLTGLAVRINLNTLLDKLISCMGFFTACSMNTTTA